MTTVRHNTQQLTVMLCLAGYETNFTMQVSPGVRLQAVMSIHQQQSLVITTVSDNKVVNAFGRITIRPNRVSQTDWHTSNITRCVATELTEEINDIQKVVEASCPRVKLVPRQHCQLMCLTSPQLLKEVSAFDDQERRQWNLMHPWSHCFQRSLELLSTSTTLVLTMNALWCSLIT